MTRAWRGADGDIAYRSCHIAGGLKHGMPPGMSMTSTVIARARYAGRLVFMTASSPRRAMSGAPAANAKAEIIGKSLWRPLQVCHRLAMAYTARRPA